MKKIFIFGVLFIFSLVFTSCLSVRTPQSHILTLPESPETAMSRIRELEENDEYIWSFKAEDFRGNKCKFYLLDTQYLRIEYPGTNIEPEYYYYKLYGNYLENSKRKGVYGHAINLSDLNSYEILFRNNFIGGYKFQSRSDQQSHDPKFQKGYVTWNYETASVRADMWNFLNFFQPFDREIGNTRDLVGTLYYTKSKLTLFEVTWEGKDLSSDSEIQTIGE